MRKIIIVFLLITFLAVGGSIQAASLYSLSDVMTRQAPGIASDHTIRFNTPLAFSNGQTIAIQFAAGFNLTSILTSDVTVSYGPATGNENSLTTTTLVSSNTLTITNLGTLISTNDKIVVKIGLLAGGTNQIINPSTTGSKVIRVTLSNGASGSLAVPINPDTVGISDGLQGGGGSGIQQPSVNLALLAPTITSPNCQIFQTPYLTKGDRPEDVFVYANNTSDGVTLTSITRWEKLMDYILGSNSIDLYGIHLNNQRTATNNYQIQRCKIGDVNCNTQVNDYDLAGLAWHWTQNWCQSDFNKDLVVNDFDLAGLASHWGL